MTIEIVCECGKRYVVDDGHAGKKAKCAKCGRSFRVPGPIAPNEQIVAPPQNQPPLARPLTTQIVPPSSEKNLQDCKPGPFPASPSPPPMSVPIPLCSSSTTTECAPQDPNPFAFLDSPTVPPVAAQIPVAVPVATVGDAPEVTASRDGKANERAAKSRTIQHRTFLVNCVAQSLRIFDHDAKRSFSCSAADKRNCIQIILGVSRRS